MSNKEFAQHVLTNFIPLNVVFAQLHILLLALLLVTCFWQAIDEFVELILYCFCVGILSGLNNEHQEECYEKNKDIEYIKPDFAIPKKDANNKPGAHDNKRDRKHHWLTCNLSNAIN